MHTPLATSTCLDDCDLSWTTGMPVHPDPTLGVSPARLRPKDLRDMIVLAAVCVISTIVFVPPLAGVMRSTSERPELVARDLAAAPPLAFSPKPRAIPVSLNATSAATSSEIAAPRLTRRAAPRGADRRPLAARLGRVLTGDGRYRVQPFPRPSEFE